MKRRLTPILTIVAIVLIGSIAYAADRRKQARQLDQPTDPIHEEEALRAEILAAVEDHENKQPPLGTVDKGAVNKSQAKKGHSKKTPQ